jgi:hypothetical protein
MSHTQTHTYIIYIYFCDWEQIYHFYYTIIILLLILQKNYSTTVLMIFEKKIGCRLILESGSLFWFKTHKTDISWKPTKPELFLRIKITKSYYTKHH